MKRQLVLISLAFLITGCGPSHVVPMPVRLNEKGQKAIDEAWEKALTPIDRLDHQAMLDVLICTQAYQTGVDKLTFRSEKKVHAGTVIMTISYDRAVPEEDRFEVKLVDPKGEVLRHERFEREEVENTTRQIFGEYEELKKKKELGKADALELEKLSQFEARRKVIDSVYPNFEKENGNPVVTNKGKINP